MGGGGRVPDLANCRTAVPVAQRALDRFRQGAVSGCPNQPGGSSLGSDWAVRPPARSAHPNEARIYRAFPPARPFAAERPSSRKPLTPNCEVATSASCRRFVGEKSEGIPTSRPLYLLSMGIEPRPNRPP